MGPLSEDCCRSACPHEVNKVRTGHRILAPCLLSSFHFFHLLFLLSLPHSLSPSPCTPSSTSSPDLTDSFSPTRSQLHSTTLTSLPPLSLSAMTLLQRVTVAVPPSSPPKFESSRTRPCGPFEFPVQRPPQVEGLSPSRSSLPHPHMIP